MDQREPRRNSPAAGRPRAPIELEGDARNPQTPPPRRFTRPVPRRSALALAVVLGAVVVTSLAVNWGVEYLHAQRAYQLSYREIVLDPPPPPWFRGGFEAFLDHVWAPTREPRSFSQLDVEPGRLTVLFRRYAWVREVLRVEKGYPNRVVVRLVYREPVAEDRRTATLIDRDGVILTRDDVDREAVGPLIALYGFAPPEEPRPGLFWGRIDPRHGVCLPDEGVVAAARLSAFLKERLGGLSGLLPPAHRVVVHPRAKGGRQGLYVEITVTGGDSLMVFWDDPDAGAAVRKLSPEAKWALLRDWVRGHPPGGAGEWVYLVFTQQGLAPDPDPEKPAPPPTSLSAPGPSDRAGRRSAARPRSGGSGETLSR
jgi:hypothetical protein